MAIAQLRRVCRETNLEFALRVGQVIIHYAYGGDVGLWRSHGKKRLSFRRLAADPRLPVSASTLCRCVAMYEICDRLNVPSRWEHITTSHLRLVLSVPVNTQESVLAEANRNRWSVRELGDALSSKRRTRKRRSKRGLHLLSIMGHVERTVAGIIEGQRELPRLSFSEVETLGSIVAQLRDHLHRVEEVLQFASSDFPDLDAVVHSDGVDNRVPARLGTAPGLAG